MLTAAAIGIDLGSQNIVIGCAKKGGVDIMINEGSHRETPFIVGYGANERFIGEQGATQLKSNFKNTVIYPRRFLGMKGNSSLLSEEAKFIYNKIATTEDGRVGFALNYHSEDRTFIPEQIVATMLQKLKDIIHKNSISHNDYVLTVPSYYTEQERRALLDAAKLADINVIRLLNEHCATALAYGIFRKAELDETPRNVLFVDIGHSSTSVFLAGFTKEKVTILDQNHERSLGARDLDWILLNYYANMFNSANGLNPLKSDKARLRLLEVIEKQRKILSANNEAAINIEYLMEDYDLNHLLKRDEYEKMVAPVINKLKEVLSKIEIQKYPIHSVEIIGGATRIPIFQQVIQDAFKQPLSRTMNATECIARGAAIQAAMLSPLFKVAEYSIEDSIYYPIQCAWSFVGNCNRTRGNKMDIESSQNNPAEQQSVLFDHGCHIPSVKAINFHRADPIELSLYYSHNLPGIEQLISKYIIYNCLPSQQDFKVKAKLHYTRDGLLEFNGSELIEGTKANSESSQKSTALKTEIVFQQGLSQKQLNQYFEDECHMANQDRIINETYQKKNELESYIYDMRGKLMGDYANYVDPKVRDSLLSKFNQSEEWLYGEGVKASKGTYTSKLEALKKVADSINSRAQEYEDLHEYLSSLLTTVDNLEHALNQKNQSNNHISAKEKQAIASLCTSHKKWASNAQSALQKASKVRNPPITVAEVQGKLYELQKKATPLVGNSKSETHSDPKDIGNKSKKSDMDIES